MDWLERMLARFADPQVALVYGKQRGNETTKYSEHQVFAKWFPEKSNLNQDHPFCNNANAAIRWSLWEQLPYDETLLEAGAPANVSRLECGVHVGTHVDAPWHFWEDGATVKQLPLDVLIGPVIVAYLPEVSAVTVSDLANLALPPGTKRLLLRTRNSELWAAGVTEFREDYVALTADAARWVMDQGIRLIGMDYLSAQRYNDSPLVHQNLPGGRCDHP
jgi:hypothetical protein